MAAYFVTTHPFPFFLPLAPFNYLEREKVSVYCIEAYCATHFLVDSSKVARRVLHRRQCFEKAFIIRRSVCHHYSVAPSRILYDSKKV